MASVDDLDAKAFDVLEAVYESGGEANTSEIKEYTGIEKNAIIHYRYDRLEDAGLITTRTGEATGARVPPKVAVLTDEGKEQIAAGLFDSEDSTIVERMDRLERQFGAVVDQFRNVEQEVRQFRYDGETDEEVTAAELVDRIEELSELSEQIEEVTDGEGLGDVLDRVDSMEDTVERYRELVDTMDTEHHELKARVLDGDDGLVDIDADGLREQVDEAETEAEESRAEVEALRDDMAAVRSNQKELETRLDTLTEQVRKQRENDSRGFLSWLR